MQRTILLFGTFDFLHIGHIYFLQQAKRRAAKVVVALARDTVVKQLKGSLPLHNERERRELLCHVDLIDDVLYGDKVIGTYKIISRVKPTYIGIGHDQHELYKDLRYFLKNSKEDIQIVKLRPYKKGTRSTLIKQIIRRTGHL